MEASAKNGFTNATDAADYLVNKGVPFRDAHGIVAVSYTHLDVYKRQGPSLRVPFLQSVQKIPKYKMISDLYPSDVTTKDKKVMTVDSFVIWDINDPVKYLASLNASKEKAEVRLGNVVYNLSLIHI